jgi:ABC-type antimicrobial peptide transport system permease subunit
VATDQETQAYVRRGGCDSHGDRGRVTLEAFSMLSAGSLAGLAMGLASARYLGTLLYQVSPTDPSAVAFPSLTILAMALLASALPVVRAAGADPAALLRVE